MQCAGCWCFGRYRCAPSNADQYPGADETCNEEDADCDGLVDEEPVDAQTWYADDDGDGYGDIYDSETACDGPSDYVSDATDCDDEDSAISRVLLKPAITKTKTVTARPMKIFERGRFTPPSLIAAIVTMIVAPTSMTMRRPTAILRPLRQNVDSVAILGFTMPMGIRMMAASVN